MDRSRFVTPLTTNLDINVKMLHRRVIFLLGFIISKQGGFVLERRHFVGQSYTLKNS
jgi:hypothetical protein